MLKDHGLEAEESELRDEEPDGQRTLSIALLIFSLGFLRARFFGGLEGSVGLRKMWLARCANRGPGMPGGPLSPIRHWLVT